VGGGGKGGGFPPSLFFFFLFWFYFFFFFFFRLFFSPFPLFKEAPCNLETRRLPLVRTLKSHMQAEYSRQGSGLPFAAALLV